MRLSLLFLLVVGGLCAFTQAEAATRIGMGLGQSKVKEWNTDYRKSTPTTRFSVEQEFNQVWSVEAIYEVTYFSFFTSTEGFATIGALGKYRFSPNKSTFYAKAGPVHYDYVARHKDSKKGIGTSGALGWQYVGESNWGISLEAWYINMDKKDAFGSMFTVSYGVNWFN